MKKEIIATVFVCVLAVSILTAPESSGAEDTAPMVLIDMGNGDIYWTEADTGGLTYKNVLASALDYLGLDYSFSGKTVIEGRGDFIVKSENTSKTVNTSWKLFEFEGGKWAGKSSIDSKYNGGTIALGYYPAGIVPAATPENMEVWTQVRGNSSQDGHQTADVSETLPETLFEKNYGTGNFVCGVTLVAGGKIIIVTGGSTTDKIEPKVYAYDQKTMEEVWSFEFPTGMGYEIATGAIIGEYYYLPATNGTLYKISVADGRVEYALYDEAVDTASDTYTSLTGIPKAPYRSVSPESGRTLTGMIYNTGPATIVYDYGTMFFGTSSGYVYAVDPVSMSVLWRAEIGGRMYYTNVTVSGDLIYAGALDGTLYVLEASSGKMVASEKVYTYTTTNKNGPYTTGNVTVPYVDGSTVYVGFSEGRGLSSIRGGLAVYSFDRTAKTLTETARTEGTGLPGNYFLPVKNETFSGVYFASVEVPIGRMDLSGKIETVFSGIPTVKAAMVLVNGSEIYISEYQNGGYLYAMTLDGKIIGKFQQPMSVRQWAMSAPVVTSQGIYVGTDAGFYAVGGDIKTDSGTDADDSGSNLWVLPLLVIIALLLFAYFKSRKSNMSFLNYVKQSASMLAGSKEESRIKRKKRRLLIMLAVGSVLAFVMFLISLSIGPSGSVPIPEAFSAMISSLQKPGESLTELESAVYDSRLPRIIAAIGTGIGLSIAGSIYQAVIRNPLVDPYIMGVSAGAGTFAVAALVANFTFFGLLVGTNFLTPILAAVGGVAAFFMTMLLATKAGGSSTSFVLSGVVVGLAFSSIMTIMLVTAPSGKLQSAIAWLYGSFANIGWETVWLLFFPALFLSLVPLLWTKELNLVLLGEDQAKQMGLNVKVFNRWMLILASVLTAVCVSFVGIIGFVGLVVPHVCRMILGGDHRLILPAAIVTGAALMLFADILARTVMVPQELPVGAITIMIGVPVFVYLLVKKGRMYDG
ncbi:MAG: iron chelate uptake ABC transporter family permease subunit [Candidatus Methanoplasma sp.]|jgi:iron complex transport system permease protein|nr:iron chelate uptake ABC transporter family permease subunit [Candidatus Methanoplasma sp.]